MELIERTYFYRFEHVGLARSVLPKQIEMFGEASNPIGRDNARGDLDVGNAARGRMSCSGLLPRVFLLFFCVHFIVLAEEAKRSEVGLWGVRLIGLSGALVKGATNYSDY